MAVLIVFATSLLIGCSGGGSSSSTNPDPTPAPKATAPGAPTVSLAVNGSAVTVTATPTTDGGSPITGYSATCSQGGASQSSPTGSFTFSVQPFVACTFSVTATNAAGTSTPAVSNSVRTVFATGGATLAKQACGSQQIFFSLRSDGVWAVRTDNNLQQNLEKRVLIGNLFSVVKTFYNAQRNSVFAWVTNGAVDAPASSVIWNSKQGARWLMEISVADLSVSAKNYAGSGDTFVDADIYGADTNFELLTTSVGNPSEQFSEKIAFDGSRVASQPWQNGNYFYTAQIKLDTIRTILAGTVSQLEYNTRACVLLLDQNMHYNSGTPGIFAALFPYTAFNSTTGLTSDQVISMMRTPAGDVLMAASYYQVQGMPQTVGIFKFDPTTGNFSLLYSEPGSGTGVVTKMDPAGNIYLLKDSALKKISPTGAILWTKSVVTSNLIDIAADTDRVFVFQENQRVSSDSDYFLPMPPTILNATDGSDTNK